MAQTKLQQRIEAAAKRIQDEQKRLKQLQNQQAERNCLSSNGRRSSESFSPSGMCCVMNTMR